MPRGGGYTPFFWKEWQKSLDSNKFTIFSFSTIRAIFVGWANSRTILWRTTNAADSRARNAQVELSIREKNPDASKKKSVIETNRINQQIFRWIQTARRAHTMNGTARGRDQSRAPCAFALRKSFLGFIALAHDIARWMNQHTFVNLAVTNFSIRP